MKCTICEKPLNRTFGTLVETTANQGRHTWCNDDWDKCNTEGKSWMTKFDPIRGQTKREN